MARTRVLEAGFALFLIYCSLSFAQSVIVSSSSVCPLNSITDSIFGSSDSECPINEIESFDAPGMIEGDETSLQRALNMVHRNTRDYVAVLFYASWCPFSATFKPSVSILSSLYPSIPHFAIEESGVRPSILSKYGVHGFPTLFLLNSTMRVRYHGPRTLTSLISFYSDVTGVKSRTSVDRTLLDTFAELVNPEKYNGGGEQEEDSCPFSWARSPENMLHQETYLALATLFVVLRLLYFIFPVMRVCAQFAWRRHVRLRSLWEHPLAYLNRAIQLFSLLKEPCKRSNLQEGAMNAKAWASKSLASVSFGEASTSRVVPVS